MSSVKEDSGFLPVVVEFAGVSLPGSSLFLAVDDGFIAVACNEFTRDVRCTTFCCSDCTVEDSFDTRSISTPWSPLLFCCGASRDRLTLESPLMCGGSWERALSFAVLFIEPGNSLSVYKRTNADLRALEEYAIPRESKASFNLAAVQFTGKSGLYGAGRDARLGPMASCKQRFRSQSISKVTKLYVSRQYALTALIHKSTPVRIVKIGVDFE